MMKTRILTLITGALTSVACDDSTGAPDSPGPPGTLEGPDVMLTAVTEDVYTVGAYMGEDWESFGLLADVAFDGAGNAHIVDMRADRIVVVAPDGSFVRMVGGSGDGASRLSAGRAFEPGLHLAAVSDGRLAVVDSIGYRIKLIARDGSVVGAVERPITPLAVTEAMRDAQRERYVAREVPSNVGIFRIERESVDKLTFAEEAPVIANIAVDWEDRIWVERTGEDGTGPGPTDIVTPDGGYVGTLDADGVRIPTAFGPNGLMAYIETDDVGIQVVRVIRMNSLQPAPQRSPS